MNNTFTSEHAADVSESSWQARAKDSVAKAWHTVVGFLGMSVTMSCLAAVSVAAYVIGLGAMAYQAGREQAERSVAVIKDTAHKASLHATAAIAAIRARFAPRTEGAGA